MEPHCGGSFSRCAWCVVLLAGNHGHPRDKGKIPAPGRGFFWSSYVTRRSFYHHDAAPKSPSHGAPYQCDAVTVNSHACACVPSSAAFVLHHVVQASIRHASTTVKACSFNNLAPARNLARRSHVCP